MKWKLQLAFCLMSVLCFSYNIKAKAETHQNQTITGTVYDAEKEPLMGVTVKILGSKTGTVTDLDGNFSIPSSTADATLQFSYIGYTTQDIKVTGTKPVIVTLLDDAHLLNETVVIGYGSTSKKDITGSVSSLKADDFNKGSYSDAMGLLQGKVAGLTVVKPGGANPLGSYEIILRGTNTLVGGQSPLVIIDGVVGESMRNINFEEVESMDILKDGSAAAIYGTRGTNGVIIITTKRAKTGKATIEYSGQASIQVAPRKVENLSAPEFEDALRTYVPSRIGNLYGSSTDWFDEVTNNTPFSMHHSLAISGGSKDFSHRTTVNIEDNEGILKKNNFKKYLFKTNIKQALFDDVLTLDFNATYSQRRYKRANSDVFYQAFIYNPTAPVNNADGSYYVVPESGTNYYNPVAMLNERDLNGKTNDFTGNVRGTFKIFEGLNWVNFFTYSNSDWEDRDYKTSKYPSMGQDYKGEASIDHGNYQNKQYETYASYSKDIDKHQLQAVAGYSYQEETTTTSGMANRGFDTDYYGTNNIGAGLALKSGDASMYSSKERNNLIAFFGRAIYNFDQRYLLSTSIRREGSSRFGKNNKWGWFPSVSFGWRLSEEQFMKSQHVFSHLKLRAGYGLTGNQAVGNYASWALMKNEGYFYYDGKWNNSYKPKSNPEPNLKWEMKHEYNLGADFTILGDKVSGIVDLYYRKVKDALYWYKVPVPPYLHPDKLTNVGELSNKGIELTLNVSPLDRKSTLKWTSSATFSLNRNKLDKLSNQEFSVTEIPTGWVGGEIAVNTQIMKENQALGTFYGPVWVGLDELGKDLFKNANPIGEVSSDQWEKIGRGTPDFTLGWSNALAYKDWDFSFAFRASIGGDILNTYRLYYENWSSIGLKNIIKTQYAETPNFEGNATYSSKYVEDASFLKLDNISLGYNVPLNAKYVSKLRLSLTAQDVFCITKYKGLDPELGLGGLTPGIEPLSYYPRTTSITFGVNVVF